MLIGVGERFARLESLHARERERCRLLRQRYLTKRESSPAIWTCDESASGLTAVCAAILSPCSGGATIDLAVVCAIRRGPAPPGVVCSKSVVNVPAPRSGGGAIGVMLNTRLSIRERSRSRQS